MKTKLALFVVLPVLLVVSGLASDALVAQDAPVAAENQVQRPASPADPAASRGPASESPYLQLPPHLRNLRPIVPPPQKELLTVTDLTETHSYDVRTGFSWKVPGAASPTRPELAPGAPPNMSPEFVGLLPAGEVQEGLQRESIIGADGRVQITATTDFPWRTVVSLAVEFPGGGGGCTGAMIDPFHIYTAGHCVHDGTNWASSIQVFPGRSGASTPYNYAWATLYRSYTAWTVDQNHEHDWAVVTLDRNIGNFTGWMGRITMGCSWPYIFGFGCDSRYGGTWNNAGYPDLAPDGSGGAGRMYFDADSGQKANDNNHWYFNDTRPGNSGGPVWLLDGTNRYIGTIHAYGNDGSGANHGTRLNQDKYDRTATWLAADAPPVDRADLLDDGLAFFYGGPTTVIRGETLMSVGSDVRNVGTANPGGVTVRYVLSSNTIISTADFQICEAFVAGVSPFNWANSDCTGTPPAGMPPGLYWLGVIIDPLNSVVEFDEGNNTAYRTATQYTVQARYPLNVTKAGTGSGTVSSSPAGISCGFDCSETYLQNTVVTLSHSASAGSLFTGWGGACAGTGPCSVTMDAAKSVTATFQLITVSVVASDPSATEAGLTTGAFTFTRSFTSATPLTVNFVVGGTASAGLDYTALSGSATIPGGAASATVLVSPLADRVTPEPGESVIATVVAGAGYSVGGPSSATVMITEGPDLLVSVISAPATSGRGATISVGATTKNNSADTGAGASETRLYLSSNTSVDASDILIAAFGVPPLGPLGTSASSIPFTIPAAIADGTWYLIAVADFSGVVPETKESNNKKTKVIKIGPDLTVSALTVSSSSPVTGTTIIVTEATKNLLGSSPAPASTTRVYLSLNTTVDAGDVLLSSRAVPPLAPNAASSFSHTVALPPGVSGPRYIIVAADADNVVVETKETNNKKTKLINILP